MSDESEKEKPHVLDPVNRQLNGWGKKTITWQEAMAIGTEFHRLETELEKAQLLAKVPGTDKYWRDVAIDFEEKRIRSEGEHERVRDKLRIMERPYMTAYTGTVSLADHMRSLAERARIAEEKVIELEQKISSIREIFNKL